MHQLILWEDLIEKENENMQFRDLHAQYEALKSEINSEIQSVLDNSNFILGQPVEELETKLAEYVGRKYCITCGNGTEALQLSLMAMDVGPGDAVFTSDFTYFASAGCASIIGATPVLVDIDIDTFNISPDALEKAILRTLKEGELCPKAVIPVDLFGLPADYERIIPIAKKYGLKIIEDAAQGFGGTLHDKKSCSFGDMSATSFFPAKPLGCYGDGGAIFTDDDYFAERLKSLRASGKSPTDKYDNREIGINSRLDTLQAAILLPKFEAFKNYELQNVNRIANRYTDELAGKVKIPTIPAGFYSSWAQYTILLDNRDIRDGLQIRLKEHGIPSMIYYPRGLHQQKAYSSMNLYDDFFTNTVKVTNRCLSLPIGPYLNENDQQLIIQTLSEELK